MTQVTTGEAPAGRDQEPETVRLISHVAPDVKERLTMQAGLEGQVPAALVNRILAAGLMTYEQIAEATLARGSARRATVNGAY